MSRLLIGRLITVVAALGCIIGALLFVVSPAFAGNFGLVAVTPGTGTVSAAATIPISTPTITPTTSTPGAGTATTAPYVPTNLFVLVLLILLLFGLLLIAGLLFYIYRVQLKYYAASQRLSQMGVTVKASMVSIIPDKGKGAVDAGPEPGLKIEGPDPVTVGAPATFTATKLEDQKPTTPAKEAKWEVIPREAASVSPETGEKVTVTPLKTGAFNLRVRITGVPSPVEHSVSAVAPQATTLELPFIGQGYGSLVIAILVVVAIIVLALTGTLQGEAVGTLLGGLLGYIFGVNTSSGGTPPKNSGSNAPSANS